MSPSNDLLNTVDSCQSPGIKTDFSPTTPDDNSYFGINNEKKVEASIDSIKIEEAHEEGEDLDRAHHALTLLLIYKERIETSITIGGVQCHIKASYLNGRICGNVSSALSAKKFDFEFDPLKSLHKKNLIIAEVKRLYWDYYPPGE